MIDYDKKTYKQLEFSFNYTEPLLAEVMERTLKDVSPERREAIAQEMAWDIHPDNPKFKNFDEEASDAE